MQSRTLAIDFDGTISIHDPDTPGIIGPPVPGAIEALHELKRRGYMIIIHTCRGLSQWAKEEIPLVEEWLDKHKIEYAFVTASKPVAMAYIDDRAINFAGNWESILKALPMNLEDMNKLRDSKKMAASVQTGAMRLIQAIYEEFDQIGSFTVLPAMKKSKDGWTDMTIHVKCK